MKILVTGKNGQLGHELMKTLAPLGKVIGVDVKECDLSQSAAIEALLDKVSPDIIVNTAAYTAVDKAESESTIAHALNAQAPKILARYAARHNILLVHFSTDYVFDGTKEEAYQEDDKANPKSVYGKTKWLGEESVRTLVAKHIIIRTSWMFGSYGDNFLKTMLKLAQEHEKLSVVADQFGAPTSAKLLAEVTTQIIKELQEPGFYRKFGTYHVVAKGETSWHGYAKFVLEQANAAGLFTKIAPNQIKPIATKKYPLPAPRPSNSRLDTKKVLSTFSIKLPRWQDEVARVVKEILQGDKDESK